MPPRFRIGAAGRTGGSGGSGVPALPPEEYLTPLRYTSAIQVISDVIRPFFALDLPLGLRARYIMVVLSRLIAGGDVGGKFALYRPDESLLVAGEQVQPSAGAGVRTVITVDLGAVVQVPPGLNYFAYQLVDTSQQIYISAAVGPIAPHVWMWPTHRAGYYAAAYADDWPGTIPAAVKTSGAPPFGAFVCRPHFRLSRTGL